MTHGAAINGVNTDPVTYLRYGLRNRFEATEDERAMVSGTQILDCMPGPSERIDSLLTRFDMARHETAQVGAGITSFSLLATILLRSCRVTGDQTIRIVQPIG